MRRVKSRILIVDVHPIIHSGYQSIINGQTDLQVCGGSSTVTEALRDVEQLTPDLVITDLTLPGCSGLEFIKLLLRARADSKILIISHFDEMLYAPRALRAGARGYLAKNCGVAELLSAIRRVLASGVALHERVSARMIGGGPTGVKDHHSPLEKLTDREFAVFQLFANGKSIKEIAGLLEVSPKTVAVHRDNIKGRLGFSSSVDLLRFAAQWAETQKHEAVHL